MTRAWSGKRCFMWWLSPSAAQKPVRNHISTYSRLEQIWTESA